ncbi:MAG: sn-glycerol-3-phosphate ABC transporter ATP-binding protein UgpC [Hyphomicrobiaceae bacterium]|nr:sn-glycerol-3-phosphate ABC transporter ATP-binding protein UgpC [Hyphomicrobiaceae bacterium]
MASVTLQDVCKVYPGGVEAVRGLSLTMPDGTFTVLLGPSGCGKSTLLRMIAGLETITAGSISIAGKRVNEVEPADRDIAMVFQNYALYPHMSVYDNMAYGLRNRGVPRGEIERRVAEAARLLAIDTFLKRKPRELSGGQRQRVAMGRAIVREPQAFLFDEPLSNLDAKLRVQMRAEIRRLHNRLKATSIFVTHDQVEAMTLADLVVVMNAGCIEQSGAPTEVYRLPATRFVATFIGSPAMNLIPGKVVGAGVVETGGGRIGFAADAFLVGDDQAVEVGIRPEDLRFGSGGAGELHFIRDFVEELGATRLIHGNVGSDPITLAVAATAADAGPSLAADRECVHLFDPATGKSLRR